jgi:hypothetical protein
MLFNDGPAIGRCSLSAQNSFATESILFNISEILKFTRLPTKAKPPMRVLLNTHRTKIACFLWCPARQMEQVFIAADKVKIWEEFSKQNRKYGCMTWVTLDVLTINNHFSDYLYPINSTFRIPRTELQMDTASASRRWMEMIFVGWRKKNCVYSPCRIEGSQVKRSLLTFKKSVVRRWKASERIEWPNVDCWVISTRCSIERFR